MSRKKTPRKSAGQLRAETDRLARQAKRTKEQLDKVQHAADKLAEQAGDHTAARARKKA